MKTTLGILSLLSIILGVFWSFYALANGYRALDGDPSYFLPQAFLFLASGVVGWAIFGALSRVLGHLERLTAAPSAADG